MTQTASRSIPLCGFRLNLVRAGVALARRQRAAGRIMESNELLDAIDYEVALIDDAVDALSPDDQYNERRPACSPGRAGSARSVH